MKRDNRIPFKTSADMLCRGFYDLVDDRLFDDGNDGMRMRKPYIWGDVKLHALWRALWLEGDPGECQVSEEESFEGLLGHDENRYARAFDELSRRTFLPAAFFRDLLYQDIETALLNLNKLV